MDTKHAENTANSRFQSGIIIYFNNASIIWYSKHHNTIESKCFGSEFVALIIATEIIETLWYKLRCFGVPVDGAIEVFCDKKLVVKNWSITKLVLKKRE